jgi:hypothetical protein
MDDKNDRSVTLRRSIEQVIHCLEEGLSVLENNEDPRCALDDFQHANYLLSDVVLPKVAKVANAR